MAETFRPTEAMATEAKRALGLREEFKRGGTRVGVARANQLAKRENLSAETVKRMASYFARHEVDKKAEGFRPGEKGFPSAGRIAWGLWGGDAGQKWANANVERIKKEELKMENETGVIEQALAATRFAKGVAKARQLIRDGKVVESTRWRGPSPSAENNFIEKEGWAEYSSFFMGIDREAEAETKARFKYPFSADFENVSINGLRAIRTRSAQNDEDDIFSAAGKLLDEAKKKMEAGALDDSANLKSLNLFTLEASPFGVNAEAGTIEGISIISAGEAKGHGMMISEKSLESAITLLMGKSLPAYLSHDNAFGDRLLTEAGMFSGFYRDGEQIRAQKFKAFESFKKYDREKYDRLFEMASMAPNTFGVSIVFEGQLFWEMADGSERSMELGLDTPENARFDVPTIRPLAITSADFVDTPAANAALFSEKVDTENKSEMKMATEENQKPEPTVVVDALGDANESASAHHETDDEPQPPVAEPAPEKAKGKKKKLSDEVDAAPEVALEEPDNEYQRRMRAAVEEVATRVNELKSRVDELQDMTGVPDRPDELAAGEDSETAALQARVDELEKLHAGTEPIGNRGTIEVSKTKDELIKEHLEAHPNDCPSTAVLAVAKSNPELFQNN